MNRFKRAVTLVGILIFLSCMAWGQAVFAPVIGAEWKFHFQTDSYYDNIPFTKPKEGILTVNYTKDTIINGLQMKMLEQKGIFRYKGSDTIKTFINSPLIMTQRHDSALLLVNDKLETAFVYKNQIGSITKLKNNNSTRVQFSIEIFGVGDTTAINNANYSFKKFTYKLSSLAVDLYFESHLTFLGRIGPINSDLTVIKSQGEPINYADVYRLICYQDSEVGALKFSHKDCDNLVYNKDSKTLFKDVAISYQNGAIHVSLANSWNDFIRRVCIYDINGRLVFNTTNTKKSSEIVVSKNHLSKGVLIITVEGNNHEYKASRIIIH